MASRVVAIDGPAGSGKSTTARAVAQRLDLPHVESGALYRALTLAALDGDLERSGQKLVALARDRPVRLAVTATGFRPEIAGVDVSEAIRSARVTARVSEISAIPAVREWATSELRAAVARHPRGAVLEGRDIGSVVFPDAAVKIYLTASPTERARRRLLQQGKEPDQPGVAEAVQELARRDDADAGRLVAPLTVADGAEVLDTTGMSFEEQVDEVVHRARKVFS